MLPFLALLLFLCAEVLAVSVRSLGTVAILVLIGLGAVAAIGWAVGMAKKEQRVTKISAGIGGSLVGGATIYSLAQLSEALGWIALVLVLPLAAGLIWIMTCVFSALWSPVRKVGMYLGRGPTKKSLSVERGVVRVGIPVLLGLSCYAAIRVSHSTPKSEIPSFAFSSHVVLAVQLALLFFYALLLVSVPLVRAFLGGELPIELSLRGARFADKELGEAGEKMRRRLKKLEDGAIKTPAQIASAVIPIQEQIQSIESTAQVERETEEEIGNKELSKIVSLEAEVEELRQRAKGD
jgi:hypothetical protein